MIICVFLLSSNFPAAINATANKIGAHLVPNNGAKTYAHPEFQLHTFQLYKMWLQPKLAAFTKSQIQRNRQSIKLYFKACLIVLSNFLVCTKECRYKLCGITVAL
jgi:hypothetical protein